MGGRDKLMEPVRGRPLLQDRVRMMMDAPVDLTIVVLPPDKPERNAALAEQDVQCVVNDKATSGMASSIQIGLAAVPHDCVGAVIMPADMPNITADHIALMIATFVENPTKLLRAAGPGGKAKSPALIPRDLFPAFDTLSGDQGGRALMAQFADRAEVIPLDGTDPTLDLDTPEDWAAWQASQTR